MIYGPYVSLANATENHRTSWFDLKPPNCWSVVGFYPSPYTGLLTSGLPTGFVIDSQTGSVKYSGYNVSFSGADIQWSSPGGVYPWNESTHNIGTSGTPVYVRTGAGYASLDITGTVSYRALIPSGIVIFTSTKEMGLVRATGNWEAPFNYTRFGIRSGAIGAPVVYGSSVYFIDSKGDLAYTDGSSIRSAGGAFNSWSTSTGGTVADYPDMYYSTDYNLFYVNQCYVLPDGRYGRPAADPAVTVPYSITLPPLFPSDGNDRTTLKGIMLYYELRTSPGQTITFTAGVGVTPAAYAPTLEAGQAPVTLINLTGQSGNPGLNTVFSQEIFLPVNSSSKNPKAYLIFPDLVSSEKLIIHGYKPVFDGAGKSGLGT